MQHLSALTDFVRGLPWSAIWRTLAAGVLLVATPILFPHDTRALLRFVSTLGGFFFFVQIGVAAYALAGLMAAWRGYPGLARAASNVIDVEHFCQRIDHLKRINAQQITAGIACGYYAAIFGGHGRERILEGFIPLLAAFLVAIPIGIALELLRARGRSLQLILEAGGEAS